jgi:hypothetical protein
VRRVVAAALLTALSACRPRARQTSDSGTVSSTPGASADEAAGAGLERALPVRAAEGSQPRWRYLARGPVPRGRERWRVDLTPRQGTGEPATDGRTVYLTAARVEPEGTTDGEVFAIDLHEGTMRWHTPVAGLHGEPVELVDGTVLVDTIPHCATLGAATPGVLMRPCAEGAPGGVVGLDAVTGRVRFRTAASSDTLRARWTAAPVGARVYVHDGPLALRPLTLPVGSIGPRVNTRGAVLHATAVGADLLYTALSPLGATRLVRTAVGATRPVWERPLPLRTHCPPSVVGALVILPAFQSAAVTGAARALHATDASDAWTAASVPQRVGSCGLVEGPSLHQVIDGWIERVGVGDGRTRGRAALTFEPTHDVASLVDGVLYLSARGRLVGVRVSDGATAVSVDSGAEIAEGAVLWGGRGAVVTRDPGLVIGFD